MTLWRAFGLCDGWMVEGIIVMSDQNFMQQFENRGFIIDDKNDRLA
jgi:hypothetical protein